ncbi:unnamed protein product [Camellia sinensis]
MEKWNWLQKSRLNWALKGDKNTKFFHVMAKSRQCRNMLDCIQVNGRDVMLPNELKLEVVRHFRCLFHESWKHRPKLGGVLKSINTDSAADLEVVFTESEVWAAIKNCDGNKAPGPDGFNVYCFQKCWSILKQDFMNFMSEFHENGRLVRSLKCSFFTLVPKKSNPSSLSDYRPICLIGVVYKILAKVLSYRLKRILPEVISENQSAFLGGRNILDGVLIANEIVDWWKKTKTRGVILKLDFEKAYDTVNWEYLFDMLQKFGFGARWIGWVKACVTSHSISVLVNGSPTAEFNPQKGLRQGDPLSPFLFNIVAEGLNVLLSRAKEIGLVRGATVGPNDLAVSHLQFADDTILFCEADWSELITIKRILRCFEIISGLKINFQKSVVCGVGISTQLVKDFVVRLNCSYHVLPLVYLGLPLGANPRRKSTWKPILDKIKVRLAGWKRRVMSYAGRVTMIKSVLSSLPVYYLSLFKMPECVAKSVDRLQASFLWGGSDNQRKVHLVRWGEVTKALYHGGLGIRNIRKVNLCLLVKWWWRFGAEKKALWRQLISSHYSHTNGSFLPLSGVCHFESRIWRDVMSVAVTQPLVVAYFLDNVKIEVGDGSSILFWSDKWIGHSSLENQFPRLFGLSTEPLGSLKWFVDEKNANGRWTLTFRRPLRAWEEEELLRLLQILGEGPDLRVNSEDSIRWLSSPSGIFHVRSLFGWLQADEGQALELSKFIWYNIAPPKVKFLLWLVWRGRLKTADFLHRIGVLRGNSVSLCVFCKLVPETLHHILLLCPFAWKLWSSVIDWWGSNWVSPSSVIELLHWWVGFKFRKKELMIWNVIPFAVIWSLWRLRNECIFRGAQPNLENLIELVKVRVVFWAKDHHIGSMYSFHDFISNLSLIRSCF